MNKYIIQHKILEYLFEKSSEDDDYQNPTTLHSCEDIAKNIKVRTKKVLLYHEYLHEEGEIDCNYCGNVHQMKITLKGRQSYIYSKYKRKRRKQCQAILLFVSSIISSVISILSLIVAIKSKNPNSNVKLELQLNNQTLSTDKPLIIKENKSENSKAKAVLNIVHLCPSYDSITDSIK